MDSLYGALIYARIIYAIALLVYFGYLDIKYRDIPARLVAYAALVAAFLFGLSMPGYLARYTPSFITAYILLSVMLGPGILFILYLFEMIGDADVAVAGITVLLFPLPDIYDLSLVKSRLPLHMPPVMVTILYASIATVVIVPLYGLLNMVRNRDAAKRINAPATKKILLYMMGRPMSVEDYLHSKHYYPLTEYVETKEGLVIRIRTSFSIKEEYTEHQENILRLLKKGVIKHNDIIWVTYGIPFLVPYLLGLLATILIDDYILAIIIERII